MADNNSKNNGRNNKSSKNRKTSDSFRKPVPLKTEPMVDFKDMKKTAEVSAEKVKPTAAGKTSADDKDSATAKAFSEKTSAVKAEIKKTPASVSSSASIKKDISSKITDLSESSTVKADDSRDISSSTGVIFYEGVKKDISSDSSKKIPTISSNPQTNTAAKQHAVFSPALKVITVILGVIMILGGSGCLVYYSFMSRINYESIGNDLSVSVNSFDHTSNGSSGVGTSTTSTLLNDAEVLNILLMGADTRWNQTNGNSDTMILMSIDTRNKKLKLTSFMRDTYVAIPGYPDNKLNAAFNLGGVGLTVRTIQSNYGIEIDRYAVVDFNSFRDIIDVLGGIDVYMTPEDVDYINWQFWINQQDEYRNAEGEYKETVRAQLRGVWFATVPESEKPVNKDQLTFTTDADGNQKALVHINGQQALWHARNRGEDGICSGDDYVRTQRQREVVGIIIDKMKNSDITTVMNIIYTIGPMITTNLKTTEITALASNIQKYLNYDMVSTSAPTRESIGTDYYFSDENHPIYIYGYLQSCIVISDWDNFRAKVADFVFNNKENFNDPLTTAPETSQAEEIDQYLESSTQTQDGYYQ